MTRSRSNPASFAIGPQIKKVLIQSINDDTRIALCRDTAGTMNQVRVDILRAKGAAPEVGETWFIDRSLGFWTFAAVVGYTP